VTWAHHFQYDVTGDFEKSIGDEEQGNSGVVLHTAHLQLIRHTSDFRIADVAAIDERDEIEQRK